MSNQFDSGNLKLKSFVLILEELQRSKRRNGAASIPRSDH